MGKTVRKLKSNSGVTILFALIFMLVCTVISAVILTASSVNLDKTQNKKNQQKQYYSISSAAKLIQKTFADTSCSGYESKTMYGCTMMNELVDVTLSPEKEADVNSVCDELKINDSDNVKLKKYLLDAAYKVYLSRPKLYVSEGAEPAYVNAPGKTAKPLTFKISGEDMEEVDVSVTFSRDYDITCELTVPESIYSMTLKFTATAVLPDKNNPTVSDGPTCHHSYRKLVQQQDGVYEMQTFNVDCKGVVKTLTTKISWDGGTVLKGAVNDEE